MTNGSCCNIAARTWANIIGILGAFLVFALLAGLLRHYTKPQEIGSTRGEERLKARTELSATSSQALRSYSVADQAKGVVVLPVQRGMELTIQDYKNPSAARSNMVSRIDALTAPPPKAPEKPSDFE